MFHLLTVLVIVVHIVFCLSTKQDVIVVLGSSDERILGERIAAAIQYIQNSSSPIILYVSGGVKHAFLNTVSEASIAAKMIAEHQFDDLQIILDEHATNTAENFAYLKRWVNKNYSQSELPDFVITTSDFHQTRAQLIFQGILPDVVPKWNLSKSACVQCWSDETIHIKNVRADVTRALFLLM